MIRFAGFLCLGFICASAGGGFTAASLLYTLLAAAGVTLIEEGK